ncbi:MAG: sugar ABC transporter permease [Erysipelotrichaceae bacterium]|nr:sugar ABC transporter permease [Erysipelotrichaceae bacterium]
MIKRPFFERIKPLLYLTPFIISVSIFTLYPIVNVIRMSFLEGYKYLTGAYTGVGFGNYEKVINDQYFRQAISNTFRYVILVVPISTVIAVILANLLNQKIKFQSFFQTAYFLPMVTSSLAVGLSWRYMFNDKYGILNYFLSFFGVDAISFLGNIGGNFTAVVIFGIWAILPNTIILLLSGLQNIDPLYYTAAKVDGAKTLRIFFRITVPLLAPTIMLVIIINMISTFKMYHELFPLFGGPGVAYNLFTVVYYIYYEFRVMTPPKYGYAAAAAVMLLVIVFVFTMLQRAVQAWARKERGEDVKKVKKHRDALR